MTVAVDLAPEVERRLEDIARARHQGVSEYLRTLIERVVTGGGDLPFWMTATEEEWLREFRDWADTHDDLPILPDEALTRESIYGHRA